MASNQPGQPRPAFIRCTLCDEDIATGNNTTDGTLSNHAGKAKCLATQTQKRKAVELASSRAKAKSLFQAFLKPKATQTPAAGASSTASGAAAVIPNAPNNAVASASPPVVANGATAAAGLPAAPSGLPPLAAAPLATVAPPAPQQDPVSVLLVRLQARARQLPDSIALAREGDPIVQLAVQPANLVDPDDEDALWPRVNHTLDAILQSESHSLSREQVALLIRRGPRGIDGVCTFLEGAALLLGGQRGALQPRLERLLAAVEYLIPEQAASTAAEEGQDAHLRVNHNDGGPVQVTDSTPGAAVSAPTEPASAGSQLGLCKGLVIPMLPGASPYRTYPFSMHVEFSLPWDVHLVRDQLVLQASNCRGTISATDACCDICSRLPSHSVLSGILHRMTKGVHVNATLAYKPIADLIATIRKYAKEAESQRLRLLALARSLRRRARCLDEHKKFVMAVASNRVARLDTLVRTALRRRTGIHRIVALVDAAARGVYKPKGYEEEDMLRGILFLRFGGERGAQLAYRTCGTPSPSTLRRSVHTRPLRPSPGVPRKAEVLHNISISFPEPQAVQPSPSHYVLMLDELKITDCCRWDPSTNKILGLCREHVHSSRVTLDFETTKEVELICDALNEGKVHFASEATVAALGALTDDPHRYSARPILISGTCKRETADRHAELISTLVEACTAEKDRIGGEVISVASDGESRRGLALEMNFLKHSLPPSSPLYELLGELPLFNTLVGEGNVTLDKDHKHVFKRLRNTLLREKGILIDGCLITPMIVRRHLRDTGMSASQVDALLNPDDRQDVLLMYALLRALWTLPDAADDAKPTYSTARAALRTYGRLCFFTIAPYVLIDLSLSEQLEYLSAAAHLALSLFTRGNARGAFIPPCLLLDIMHMVKNAFFCVAKTKLANPLAKFWLILLGTDRLETAFGILRSIVGNDANADILQLGGRMSHVVECANIFARFPHWDRQPRRLRMPPMTTDGEITRNADHINPGSWRGDVSVKTVVLSTCWQIGRKLVETEFAYRDFRSQLVQIENTPRADMLAPFGTPLDPEAESEELEDEWTTPSGDASATPQSSEVDFEDIVGAETCDISSISPTVHVGDAKVPIHKAKFLRHSINFRASDSVDRMRRVAKIQRYTQGVHDSQSIIDDSSALGEGTLCVNDPIATSVFCEELPFLCLGQISSIRHNSRARQSIPADLLVEDSVEIRFQVLRLKPVDESDEWRWSGRYDDTYTTLGRLVQPINPAVFVGTPGEATYTFKSSELTTLAVSLFDQLTQSDTKHAPRVKRTDAFPYRFNGRACFVMQREGADPHSAAQQDRFCPRCDPPVELDWSNAPQILQHMAAHIRHDRGLSETPEPCGFCLRPHPQCVFYLRKAKGSHGGPQVDLKKSTGCERARAFKYKAANTSKPNSPATNVPIKCPLCPDTSPAVWKYTFLQHLSRVHPRQDPAPYSQLYKLSAAEEHGVKSAWESRHIARRTTHNSKTPLQLSVEHRCVLPSIPDGSHAVTHTGFETNDSVELSDGDTSSSDDSDGEDELRSDGVHSDDELQGGDELYGKATDPGDHEALGHENLHVPEPTESAPTDEVYTSRRGRAVKRRIARDVCICGEQVTDAEISAGKDVVRCSISGCDTVWYHMACHNLDYIPKAWRCDECAELSERSKKRRLA